MKDGVSPLSPEREKEGKKSLDVAFFCQRSDCPAPRFPRRLLFFEIIPLSLKIKTLLFFSLLTHIPRTGRGGTAAACTAMTQAARREEEDGSEAAAAAAVAVAAAVAALERASGGRGEE